MPIRNVDLRDLMAQFSGFERTLGPEEYRILEEADQFLRVTIPIDDAGRVAYLSKSAALQASLNNLMSRVSIVHNMHKIDKDSYWGRLIAGRDYEGKDKWFEALSGDPRLRDMEETFQTFSVLIGHINNVLWSIKTISSRLRG